MRTALTIYENGQPAKVYEAGEASLTVGVCQDVLALLHAEEWLDAPDGSEAQDAAAKAILRAFMSFYPIAAQVFPGLTEDEYRRALPRDVGDVMLGIAVYAIEQLSGMGAGDSAKNRQGRRKASTKRFSAFRWPASFSV